MHPDKSSEMNYACAEESFAEEMCCCRAVYELDRVCCLCVAPEEGGVRPAEPDFVVGLCSPREPYLGQRY